MRICSKMAFVGQGVYGDNPYLCLAEWVKAAAIASYSSSWRFFASILMRRGTIFII